MFWLFFIYDTDQVKKKIISSVSESALAELQVDINRWGILSLMKCEMKMK